MATIAGVAIETTPTILGGLLFWLSWFLWQRSRRFLRDSLPATGEVLGYETRESTGTDDRGREYTTYTYAPIVRYTDLNGVVREFIPSLSTGKKPYSVGGPVRIRYYPQQDADARVDSVLAIYGLAIFSFSFGLILFGVGVIIPVLEVVF